MLRRVQQKHIQDFKKLKEKAALMLRNNEVSREVIVKEIKAHRLKVAKAHPDIKIKHIDDIDEADIIRSIAFKLYK